MLQNLSVIFAQSKGVLCPTSQSRIRSTALLAGEPLAKRFRFAVTHGVAIKLHRRKASPYQGRWHRAKRRCRRGCTEQHLRSPLNLKASFVQPLSLASARQLPWQESPWQRGFVFDETDWGLLENVTECQSLSLWERWHGEAVTERARMLTKSKKHSDTSPVCQRHRIAVLSCFILPGLPSQALARQLSQRESPWQGGQALVYASMPWSAGG